MLIAGSSGAQTLELHLTHAEEAGQKLCTRVVLRALPKGSRPDDERVLRIEATVPGRATIEFDPSQTYVLSTEGDECWTAPVEVGPGRPAALDLEVWPAGRVSGTLKGPKGEDLESSADLGVSVLLLGGDGAYRRVRGSSSQVPAAVALDCSTKGAAFDCIVPAGIPVGLRVALPGWVPWYAWDVEGEPGGRIKLGKIGLARGASLSGWVLAEGASRSPTAFAQPVGADRLSDRQQATLRRACEVTRNGHLQCRDLAPGQWTVVVEPPPGFGGERRSPVEVKAGEEARLDEPIVLVARFDLIVLADPPVAPGDRLWTIALLRRASDGAHTVEVAKQEASPAGEADFALVEPGRRIFELRDPEGNVLARAEEDVAPDLPPVMLTMEGVPIAGFLHRGKKPVAGKIWMTFQGHGRVTYVAGNDGVFRGVAPAEGTSRAYVTLAGQEGRIALGKVEVKRAQGADAAEVDLALPNTLISGHVVDQDDHPQPEATVSAWGENGRLVYVRSAPDGSFNVVGVPPGRVELSAEAEPSSASDVVMLTLREGDPVEGVRLVVRPKTRLRGRILGPGGPVPGALVRWAVPGRQTSLTAVTASSGRFDIDLPGAVPAADLLIVAAGLPRALRRVAASGEKVVDIGIGGEAGLLVVGGAAADSASICQGGLCMPLGSYLQIPGPMPPPELDVSTGDYRLPLEPGEWTVCHPPAGNGGCTNVQVLPGGVATVRVE